MTLFGRGILMRSTQIARDKSLIKSMRLGMEIVFREKIGRFYSTNLKNSVRLKPVDSQTCNKKCPLEKGKNYECYDNLESIPRNGRTSEPALKPFHLAGIPLQW
jgi:hypothetical protein